MNTIKPKGTRGISYNKDEEKLFLAIFNANKDETNSEIARIMRIQFVASFGNEARLKTALQQRIIKHRKKLIALKHNKGITKAIKNRKEHLRKVASRPVLNIKDITFGDNDMITVPITIPVSILSNILSSYFKEEYTKKL